MKKTFIATLITALFLSACASPPKPPMPDGGSRTQVNSESAIQNYRARTAEELANYNERTALARQVETLSRQLGELKAYVIVMQANREMEGVPKTKSVAPAGNSSARSATAQSREIGDGESIEVRDQAVIFRVAHAFGKTEFKPSKALQEELLQAARDGRHIEIRGRTDAEKENPVDKDIALQRALNARYFLVKNGIHPSKIRISYLAAGGYVADNSTAEGRARNRRVEIEAMDMNTTAYKAQPAAITVGSVK